MSFYNSVTASDNADGKGLTHNKKVKLVAAAVADELNYVKASVSKMPQSEFKGKKYGKEYSVYLPDVGTVHEGLTASPDDIVEVEANIKLQNFNTSCTLDAWNDIADIEDFKKEVAIPKGQKLARTVAKEVIKDNVFKNMQAVVGTASFGTLSDAAAALNELAVSGEVISFMHPTVMGKISAGGLANFISGQEAKEIYGRNYLGQYAGAEQVQEPLLPTITTPASCSASIALVATEDSDGFEVVEKVTGSNLKAGLVFTTGGDLKIVDQSGIETDQDVAIVILSTNNAGTEGKISPLRITVEGKGKGNPNAWVKEGTSTITLTAALEASTTYWVGQVRTKDCMAYDSYKFENLPGSENEDVSTVGGVTVKMSTYGDGTNLTKLVRLDCPFASGIWDARSAVGIYVKKV